jgi:hypothetical protein
MKKLRKDLSNTLNQENPVLSQKPIDNQQDSVQSDMLDDMVKSCNEMTQDPVLRKKIGMMLV